MKSLIIIITVLGWALGMQAQLPKKDMLFNQYGEPLNIVRIDRITASHTYAVVSFTDSQYVVYDNKQLSRIKYGNGDEYEYRGSFPSVVKIKDKPLITVRDRPQYDFRLNLKHDHFLYVDIARALYRQEVGFVYEIRYHESWATQTSYLYNANTINSIVRLMQMYTIVPMNKGRIYVGGTYEAKFKTKLSTCDLSHFGGLEVGISHSVLYLLEIQLSGALQSQLHRGSGPCYSNSLQPLLKAALGFQL